MTENIKMFWFNTVTNETAFSFFKLLINNLWKKSIAVKYFIQYIFFGGWKNIWNPALPKVGKISDFFYQLEIKI